MKQRRYPLILIAAASVLAGGCGHGDDASTANAPKSSTGPSITIADFKFAPGTTKVRSGASVDVANADDTAHTLTADDGHSFDSGTVDPGSSTTVRAPGPGNYAYHCEIHPYMKGSLVVQ